MNDQCPLSDEQFTAIWKNLATWAKDSAISPILIAYARAVATEAVEAERKIAKDKIAEYDRRIVAVGGVAMNSVSRDAYEGCREDLLDWKCRALSAEAALRDTIPEDRAALAPVDEYVAEKGWAVTEQWKRGYRRPHLQGARREGEAVSANKAESLIESLAAMNDAGYLICGQAATAIQAAQQRAEAAEARANAVDRENDHLYLRVLAIAAKRDAAYERAAKVCEAMHDEDRPGDYAWAIRSLKTREHDDD